MTEFLLLFGLAMICSVFAVSDDDDDAQAAKSPSSDLPPEIDTALVQPDPDTTGLRLVGGPGDDLLTGGAGNDTLIGNLGDDTLSGARGADLLFGRGGDDLLTGGAGDDTLWGENGTDQLYGGAGQDLLYGGAGSDALFGGAGDDTLHGDAGDDVLEGGAGQDMLYGGDGDDVLIGYLRPDGTAVGDAQGDTQGEAPEQRYATTDTLDPDTLYGGAGEDLLVLGRGDVAYGGEGEDTFLLGPWMTGPDDTGTIADFDASGEEILIIVPLDYAGETQIDVETDGADAILRMDGQIYARITDAAQTLTPAMISVAFSPFVTANG